MDNLTHSFAGAVLGQMGLKRKTGLAMPALIIGANIPDIDAMATIIGTPSLAIRRGITHGPVALIVLPLILTGLLLAYHRWRPNPARAPVHSGWLLAIAYIGTLSHPALDWLNSYGIRFLEPFSSQWFAGDTIFIIDVWIWAALILAFWRSRSLEKAGRVHWTRPAWIGFAAIGAYIFANGLITRHAESVTAKRVQSDLKRAPTLVVANPLPVMFWRREMLWRDQTHFGAGDYVVMSGETLRPGVFAHNMNDPNIVSTIKTDKIARAYLFWSRMPIAERQGRDIFVHDQRFNNPIVGDRFTVRVEAP
jgi:inner membrane protein